MSTGDPIKVPPPLPELFTADSGAPGGIGAEGVGGGGVGVGGADDSGAPDSRLCLIFSPNYRH
jgi:hypothetical protein